VPTTIHTGGIDGVILYLSQNDVFISWTGCRMRIENQKQRSIGNTGLSYFLFSSLLQIQIGV
jgi:hypothetical protein